MSRKPTQTTVLTPQLRRRNILLAVGLLVFAFSLATTVFVWRYSHHQPAIPQGGSYGQTYNIQN
ncbi:MAG: hypothetical protein EON60_09305 [Alphaproteobacteria bacterium]|nr:MAG: hypothetical protein EON60_09305 [Alphaproteobacteria bacterium]